ncbi:MAG: hypothetical protein O9277_00790 [Magnetospirillum sp.]|nr:hypothetical protein [Magnetospirillum sp.]
MGHDLAGKNSSENARAGQSQTPNTPPSAALAGARKERTATANGVGLVEGEMELEKAFNRLMQKHGHFISGKRRPETVWEYRQVARRAVERSDPPKLAHYPRRSRGKVRAAVIFVGIGEIIEALEICLDGREAAAPDARAAALAEGHRWVDRIRAVEMPVDEDNDTANLMTRNPARRKLRNLPDGWEDRLFETARAYSKWFYGVCVALASGVRPVELERGVLVRREGVNLELVVNTAKSSEKHEGIGARTLLMALDMPWVQALATELGDRAEMIVNWPSAKKSRDVIAAIGRAALPDIKETISGYVLRHRFASMLKKAKWSPIEIARALGHASTKQRSSYGSWNGAVRSGGLPLRVTTEREPRDIGKPRDFISRRQTRSRSPERG